MSIVRGSRGIIYFCHQFKPASIEAGLLADAEMLAAVTAINRQIHELTAVINSPNVADFLSIESANAEIPVEAILKRHAGDTYVFSVNMRDQPTTAALSFSDRAVGNQIVVLGENRELVIKKSQFQDSFAPWGVHLYRIKARE